MRRLLAILLVLGTQSSAARAEEGDLDSPLLPPCIQHAPDEFVNWVEAVQDRLVGRPWDSAHASMVEKAPCRRKRSLDEILKELATAQGSKRDYPDAQVRGIRLRGQNPALVQALNDLVTKRTILGDALPENQQEKLDKAKGCSDVICASKAIFGNEIGPRLLFLRQHFGMNASDLAGSNRSRPNVNELDSFIRAMDDLPPHLMPLKQNYSMSRFKRGYTLGSYGPGEGSRVLANATMTFFDLWGDQKQDAEKDRVCIHELGHVLGHEFGVDSSPEWLAISGWENRGKGEWKAKKPETIMSEYGNTNPDEDFAEAVTAYRYNPAGLKKASLAKYEFLKKHIFAGLEYFQQGQCNIYPPRLRAVKESVDATLGKASSLDSNQLKHSCAKSLVGEFSNNIEGAPSIDACVANLFVSQALASVPSNASSSELDRKTLEKHIGFAQTGGSSALVPQELASNYRDTILHEFQADIAKGLQAQLFGSDYLKKGDCDHFAMYGFMGGDLSKRYQDDLFDIRIKEFLKGISSAYCSYHKENYGTSGNVNPHDALYFTTKAIGVKLKIPAGDWKKVEELRARRAALLRELNGQSILAKAKSFITKDPRASEVQTLENEIEKILLGK